MSLFNDLSKKLKTELEISPFVLDIFKDAEKKYGSRAWSSMVVKRLEDKFDINFRAAGFPEELIDEEKEETIAPTKEEKTVKKEVIPKADKTNGQRNGHSSIQKNEVWRSKIRGQN